jgi:hypothetical protein
VVFVHPLGCPQLTDRLAPACLNNIVGQPLETTIALISASSRVPTTVRETRRRRPDSCSIRRVTAPPPELEELNGPLGREIARRQPLTLEPEADMGHQPQLGCGAPRRVTLQRQRLSEAVAMSSKRATHNHPRGISHG